MSSITLKRELVPDWLKRLMKEYTVFAPHTEAGDERTVLFGRLTNPEYADLTAGRTRNSAKSALFPQVEELLRFSSESESAEPASASKKPLLLFGVTPCDARAFLCLDRPFLEEEPRDLYYGLRRKNAVIVGLACNRPWRSCFCDTFGSGPFSTEGMDLQIVDLSDRLLVMPVTEKGAEILKLAAGAKKAGGSDLKERDSLKKRAEKNLEDSPPETTLEVLEAIDFNDPLWERIHLACLGCGACTYNCPTCHCFDISDESRGNEGRRFRFWDTCQFPLFTLQASGHNPHPTGKERIRQRILHKFQFFPSRYEGAVACVGCGRCIEACPVNLDIREVIEILARERIA